LTYCTHVKRRHKEIVEFEFKHGTFLTVVAGWFIHPTVAPERCGSNPVHHAVHSNCASRSLSAQFKARSDDAFCRIVQPGFVGKDMLARHTIANVTARSFIFVHSLMMVGICTLILNVTLTI
jgi:hypothetical protein